jgi:hypothetical protein
MNPWDLVFVIGPVLVAFRFGYDLRATSEGEVRNSPRAGVYYWAILLCIMCVNIANEFSARETAFSTSASFLFPIALALPMGLGHWAHSRRSERRRRTMTPNLPVDIVER